MHWLCVRFLNPEQLGVEKLDIWFDFRLKLYWKLFVVMGVSWVFELASWAYPGKSCWTWIVTDVINLLQGLWFETCLLP